MKVLAVLQLILAVAQVVIWFLYRRDVKRRERASQEPLERINRQALPPFKLDGCTCPPPYPRNWHFGKCQWGN